MKDGFRVIDADRHVMEPSDLWDRYLPQAYQGRVYVGGPSQGVRMVDGTPVSDAFKQNAQQVGKNLMAAAEEMPADKYSFKPTPAQMSFADVVVHLANGNDYLCGAISGAKAPTRTKIDATAPKDALVARLKETFQFCDQSLATVDDSKLGEQIPFFGGKPWTRDVTFHEDDSQLRTDTTPRTLASYRNPGTNTFRLSGRANIAHTRCEYGLFG